MLTSGINFINFKKKVKNKNIKKHLIDLINKNSPIIQSLSKLIGIDESLINLKGKTVEKLGLIGKEKAIACEVIVSVSKYD